MERKFAIITDSACDMPEEYFKEHDIEFAQLGVTIDGKNYRGEDGAPLSQDEFYTILRNGAMPTTSQVTAEGMKPHMEKLLKEGKDILGVAFSSGLSGTAGSYEVAARELRDKYPDRKIEVVDSLCASLGFGLFLDYVVRKADEGVTLEEAKQYAEDLKLHICHEFTVKDLVQLRKGGRISTAVAVVGSMLKIKPIMHMDDAGHLVAVGKKMGRKAALRGLVERMDEFQDLQDGDRIFICHSDCLEEAEGVKAMIEEKYPGHEVWIGFIGPVIASHTGVGTISIFYRGKHR